jgi:hypothetical protein
MITFGLSMGFPPGFAIMESRRTPPATDPEDDLVPWRLDGPELRRLRRRSPSMSECRVRRSTAFVCGLTVPRAREPISQRG